MSTSPAPARVSIRRVNRTFGTHTVLDHIDIEIAPGEVVALLGSSGSGESTLLRIVAGLDRPTDGRIEIDGNAVRGIDPRCAVVLGEFGDHYPRQVSGGMAQTRWPRACPCPATQRPAARRAAGGP